MKDEVTPNALNNSDLADIQPQEVISANDLPETSTLSPSVSNTDINTNTSTNTATNTNAAIETTMNTNQSPTSVQPLRPAPPKIPRPTIRKLPSSATLPRNLHIPPALPPRPTHARTRSNSNVYSSDKTLNTHDKNDEDGNDDNEGQDGNDTNNVDQIEEPTVQYNLDYAGPGNIEDPEYGIIIVNIDDQLDEKRKQLLNDKDQNSQNSQNSTTSSQNPGNTPIIMDDKLNIDSKQSDAVPTMSQPKHLIVPNEQEMDQQESDSLESDSISRTSTQINTTPYVPNSQATPTKPKIFDSISRSFRTFFSISEADTTTTATVAASPSPSPSITTQIASEPIHSLPQDDIHQVRLPQPENMQEEKETTILATGKGNESDDTPHNLSDSVTTQIIPPKLSTPQSSQSSVTTSTTTTTSTTIVPTTPKPTLQLSLSSSLFSFSPMSASQSLFAKQKAAKAQRLEDNKKLWQDDIIPTWPKYKTSRKTIRATWDGIPSLVRGHVWKLMIGNAQNVSVKLFHINAERAAVQRDEKKKLLAAVVPIIHNDELMKLQDKKDRELENGYTGESEGEGDEGDNQGNKYPENGLDNDNNATNTQDSEAIQESLDPEIQAEIDKKREIDYHQNKMKEAMELSSGWTAQENRSNEKTLLLIEKDLHRTMPELNLFGLDRPLGFCLRRILEAFVLYRPDVGYMQGMSYLGAILLLNLDVESAFVAFVNILTNDNFVSFDRLDEQNLIAYMKAFETLFIEEMPLLHAHFVNLGITTDLYLYEWFSTVFVRSFPLDISLRIWDNFLCNGQIFLFKAALGYLKYHHDAFLSQGGLPMEIVLPLLCCPPKDLKEDTLFQNIEKIHISERQLQRALTQ